MKVLTLIFAALIALLQYPLWLGKGSWLKVWEVDQQVKVQHQTNQKQQSSFRAIRFVLRLRLFRAGEHCSALI